MCGGAVHAFDRFDSGAERCVRFMKKVGLCHTCLKSKHIHKRGTTVGRPAVGNL